MVQANHAGCTQMMAEGLPHEALGHIEQLLNNYRFDLHHNLALMYGAHDPGCCALSKRAFILTMLGHLDQAEAESAKALELSERVGHKPSVAHTCQFRAEYDIILNRPEKAEPYLDRCISLSEKYSLAAYHNAADLMQGFVRVVRGDVETGVRQAEAALETLKSVPVAPIPPADTNVNRRASQSGSRRYRGSARDFRIRARRDIEHGRDLVRT